MKVCVDTSALLALINGSDAHHAAVVSEVTRLSAEGAAFFTTSYTLVETGALVKDRLGQAAFRSLGEVVERSLDVVWVDEALHRRAWAEAAAATKRGPSLVDCVGFSIMRQLGVGTALAIDAHFRKAGFEVVPR